MQKYFEVAKNRKVERLSWKHCMCEALHGCLSLTAQNRHSLIALYETQFTLNLTQYSFLSVKELTVHAKKRNQVFAVENSLVE